MSRKISTIYDDEDEDKQVKEETKSREPEESKLSRELRRLHMSYNPTEEIIKEEPMSTMMTRPYKRNDPPLRIGVY